MKRTRNIPERPTSPEPRRADSKEIVHAIVEAARQLPLDASVNAIAERAGVGVASVYRYFPGKDAIYAELGRHLHQRLLDEVTDRLPACDSLDEAIAVCATIALQRTFGEPHVVEHVHLNLPVSWHNDHADAISRQIIDFVADHLSRFVTGTHEVLHTRATMMLLLLRGASRALLMHPTLAPPADDQLQLIRAALMAIATDGLQRRDPPAPLSPGGSQSRRTPP